MCTVDAVLAGMVERQVPGSDDCWLVERDGVTVGRLQSLTIGPQTWWQVIWPWRPGPVCDLPQARAWLAQYLLDHPSHLADG